MQATSSLIGARQARSPRSASNVVLTGTAAGIGERLGVDPAIVRAAFVVLSFAGGVGAVAYGAAWLLSTRPTYLETPRRRLAPFRQVGAVAFITFGVMIPLRAWGLWFGDRLVWPVALAALGTTVIWVRGDSTGEGDKAEGALHNVMTGGSIPWLRIAIGALLVFFGMGAALSSGVPFTLSRVMGIAVPVLVTLGGVSLIFGPWLYRMGQQLTEERREHIRSEERAEVAAHLHDSVLQTLAMIQRSDSSREMGALARVQERELRAWLYGKNKTIAGVTLDGAIDALAGRIEQAHQVAVETVVVGDAALDERLAALVDACREAMVNAANHSGMKSISVYVEVEPDAVVGYVRDQGIGFDPDRVPEDRRGIADSIVGRMRRYRGDATIASEPGKGTEVQLRMPTR